MSLSLAMQLLDNQAFLKRCHLRIVDRLVLGGIDPTRDPANDATRNVLKAAVIEGRLPTASLVMAMLVVSPDLAVAAVSDPSNPGMGLSDDGLDAMIQAAWDKIALMGV